MTKPSRRNADPGLPTADFTSRDVAGALTRAASERRMLDAKLRKTRAELQELEQEEAGLKEFVGILQRLRDTGARQHMSRSALLFVRSFTLAGPTRNDGKRHVPDLKTFRHIPSFTKEDPLAPSLRTEDVGSWTECVTHQCKSCSRAALVMASHDDSSGYEGTHEVTTLMTVCFSCSRAYAFGECGRGRRYRFGG
ncbi:MAG: hypothetical protein RLZZ324_1167 [Candidatus Parcubacteria bacterium]|jgi:hypothetical protein